MDTFWAAGGHFSVEPDGDGYIEFETYGTRTRGGAVIVQVDTDSILALAGELVRRRLAAEGAPLDALDTGHLLQVAAMLGLEQ